MKRCCKRINITDRNLIERATKECLHGKMNRSDVIRMFSEYSGVSYNVIKKICKDKRMMNGVIQTVVDGIQQEMYEYDGNIFRTFKLTEEEIMREPEKYLDYEGDTEPTEEMTQYANEMIDAYTEQLISEGVIA